MRGLPSACGGWVLELGQKKLDRGVGGGWFFTLAIIGRRRICRVENLATEKRKTRPILTSGECITTKGPL